MVIAKTSPEMDLLSEAEVNTLEDTYKENGHKDFNQLKEEAHDRAYKRARGTHWMTYEDLAEDNDDLLDHLRLEAESV